MTKTLSVVVVCLLAVLGKGKCQDLGSIGKTKPLTVNGGLAFNQIMYAASGIANRRSPYSYYASGNLNIGIYGRSVPLSFRLSNSNTSFQQPFNQYNIHPGYKWISAHLGFTSASYSSYTLNGHVFLGAAVDATPQGKWSFGAMYGRLLKAVQPDSLSSANKPAFLRMGGAFKASYHASRSFVDLILFHARDEIGSVNYVPENQNLLPQENLAFSIGSGTTLFDHFFVKAELATSAVSTDSRAEKSGGSIPSSFLFTPRLSSSLYHALKASLDYRDEFYTIGVGLERIDPQYRTLGAYYFNNDLQNITLNGTATILNGKATVAASAGTQHDNLDKSKISTMHRAVGSVNINLVPSERMNLSLSYSNFQTFTNVRSQFQRINQLTPYDNLDTLNFTQLSRNATLSSFYNLSNDKQKQQAVNVNLSYQNASDKQGDVKQNSGLIFLNGNVGYLLTLTASQTNISLSFNGTINQGSQLQSKTIGPVASLSKSLLQRKLRLTLSTSYNSSYTNGLHQNNIFNSRLSANASVKKKHNFTASAVFVKRDFLTTENARSYAEFTGTLGYTYSFSLLK
jgi:hypothetical protein